MLMVDFLSDIERLRMGREEPGAKSVRMLHFATESVMGSVRTR